MNNMNKSLIIISTFLCCHFMMRIFWGEGWSEALLILDQQSSILLVPAKYLFIYGLLAVVAVLLARLPEWQNTLGIRMGGFGAYFVAAVVCCLPMTIGYASLSNELNFSIPDLVVGSIYAGVFEEIIFRAALFGVLFRFCRWGFVPAALLSSVIFGLGHIYQGNDLLSAFMAVGITAVAGTWFSWLYCECGYRIWFPLWMHIFMNAAYGVFGMSGGAAGDLEGNIFKASSIILSLIYVQLLIRRGKKREITLTTLWINKTDTVPLPSLKPQSV